MPLIVFKPTSQKIDETKFASYIGISGRNAK